MSLALVFCSALDIFPRPYQQFSVERARIRNYHTEWGFLAIFFLKSFDARILGSKTGRNRPSELAFISSESSAPPSPFAPQ